MFKRLGLWFQKNPEMIPLGIGVVCLLVAVALLVNPVRLVMHGKSADGVVADVTKRTVRDEKGKESVESTATIRFKAGERNMAIQRSWSEDRDGISFCFAGCYSKGEKLKMRYLVDDPDIARVGSFWGLFGGPLTFGLVGTMGIFAWWLWRSERLTGEPRR